MPEQKESSETTNNDNFQNTQTVVIPIENAKQETEEQTPEEQSPDAHSFVEVSEQHNKQTDDATSEHVDENVKDEASEKDELIEPPTKEAHSKIGERSVQDREGSDV